MSGFTFTIGADETITVTTTAAEGTVDHVTEALARLREQFKAKTNWVALTAALVQPTQDVENALFQLLTDRGVDDAEGDQLDAIGVLVGEARAGRSDDDYRRFIRARIATNRSNGTAEQIINIARLVLGDLDVSIRVENQGTAAYVMRILGPEMTVDVAGILVAFLRSATAAGVRAILEYTDGIDTDDLFTFDTGPGFDTGIFFDATE